MLRIYHASFTRGIRPIWLLEELGLPYEVEKIDFSPAYRATQEWRALNPVGKVPVMTDGELTMFESGAMMDYILARYGEGRLMPDPGSDDYAHYLQWHWFAEATFARPLGEMVNHRREFPAEQEIPDVLKEMAGRGAQCAAAVAEHVSDRAYIMGDEFTAADISIGYSLLLCEALIPDQMPTGIQAYWDRLQARSGFQVAREL
mgnify:CR=1 FL=1